MARAAAALKASPLFTPRPPSTTSALGPSSPARSRRRAVAGRDHLLVSTGCIEHGERLAQRLSGRLANLLRASIVARDRAYSAFYASSAVGRCTIEVPYVSNPYARIAYARALRRANASAAALAGAVTPPPPPLSSTSSAAARTGSIYHSGGSALATHQHQRRWLVSFMGSLDVCCEPGKSIRKAMRRLAAVASNETRVLHIARANGLPLPGRTPEEQLARYQQAGELMAESRFCLVPAGDNEVSSRLYSAMSAGCVPVVIANQLAGAFAWHVPYAKFWLRVEQQTFIQAPDQLLVRLRAIPSSEVRARRLVMLRYVADVTYSQPHLAPGATGAVVPSTPPAPQASRLPGMLPASRLATNLLRSAEVGCLRGGVTAATGVYPPTHKYSMPAPSSRS